MIIISDHKAHRNRKYIPEAIRLVVWNWGECSGCGGTLRDRPSWGCGCEGCKGASVGLRKVVAIVFIFGPQGWVGEQEGE